MGGCPQLPSAAGIRASHELESRSTITEYQNAKARFQRRAGRLFGTTLAEPRARGSCPRRTLVPHTSAPVATVGFKLPLDRSRCEVLLLVLKDQDRRRNL